MSRAWTRSIKALKWDHRFVAIYRCVSADKQPKEIIVANRKEIEKHPNLMRVLDALRDQLVNKRIYSNADNPTTPSASEPTSTAARTSRRGCSAHC